MDITVNANAVVTAKPATVGSSSRSKGHFAGSKSSQSEEVQMTKGSLAGGVGALAFAILPIVGFSVANPPGGTYKTSDIVGFVAKGHRPVVFLSIYLLLLSGVGLLVLLARLRESIVESKRAAIFWGLGVGSAAAWVAGYALAMTAPAAFAFGGGKSLTLTNGVIYTFAEAGFVVMYGAGGTLLGCALLVFALGPVRAPAWVRWSTLIAGIAGLAALAWFPFYLVYLWALVLGVWILVGERSRATEPARTETQPA